MKRRSDRIRKVVSLAEAEEKADAQAEKLRDRYEAEVKAVAEFFGYAGQIDQLNAKIDVLVERQVDAALDEPGSRPPLEAGEELGGAARPPRQQQEPRAHQDAHDEEATQRRKSHDCHVIPRVVYGSSAARKRA